jgi:hypothetical protein
MSPHIWVWVAIVLYAVVWLAIASLAGDIRAVHQRIDDIERWIVIEKSGGEIGRDDG